MKKTPKGIALTLLLVAGASLLMGCPEQVKTSDLVGTYHLVEYSYWQGGANGGNVYWHPPDVSGAIAFAGGKKYSFSLRILGTPYESSGTYDVHYVSAGAGPFLSLYPSTGGELIGGCSEDAHEVYLPHPDPGIAGSLTFKRD